MFCSSSPFSRLFLNRLRLEIFQYIRSVCQPSFIIPPGKLVSARFLYDLLLFRCGVSHANRMGPCTDAAPWAHHLFSSVCWFVGAQSFRTFAFLPFNGRSLRLFVDSVFFLSRSIPPYVVTSFPLFASTRPIAAAAAAVFVVVLALFSSRFPLDHKTFVHHRQ